MLGTVTRRHISDESYLRGGSTQEVVHLPVDVDGALKIGNTADLSLNQVVTVNGGRDGGPIHSGRHELQDSHLDEQRVNNATRTLWSCVRPTCAVASWQATRWNLQKGDVSGVGNRIRKTEAHVWAQLEIANTTSNVLIVGVVQMTVEDLLGQGEGTF